jgi:aryl-alcohol dehydrogenase-like predicted oxidoreductase
VSSFRGLLDDKEAGIARLILGGAFGREIEAASFAKLDRFAALGGSLLETSYSYARGEAKHVLGRWLRAHPDSLGVVSKVGHDLTRAALGVEVLDVLLYHCDDPNREVSELADTLHHLLQTQRVRRVGVSNWPTDRLRALVDEFGSLRNELVVSYHFSLAVPDDDLLAPLGLRATPELLDIVVKNDLALLSWSAQAQGYFARVASRGSDPSDPFETPANAERRRRVIELADRLDAPPAAVALAYTLRRPGTWATIGPGDVSQLDASVAATAIALTDEECAWLSRGGQPEFRE